MKAILFRLLLLFCLASVQTVKAEQYFSTDAPYAVILDERTGKVLYNKAGDERINPASMSKVMTAAVAFDLIQSGRYSLQTPFSVSEKAWRTGGSKMFVLVNTEIELENLLKGLLAQSGNDAAIVIAENISGSEEAFVDLMNQRAQAWGLNGSHFANPMGTTDPDHYMTPMDLAKLAAFVWEKFPEFRYLFNIEEFEWSDIQQKNRNPLLGSFPGADGLKTGYTEEAGWSLLATAEQDGVRRFLVVGGLESATERARQAHRLMRLAFSEFADRTFFQPGDIVDDAVVFGGRKESVPLMIDAPVQFILHRRELEGTKAKVIYNGPLLAPLQKGEQVAVLQLSVPGQDPMEYPLYTADTVKDLSVRAKMGIGLKALFTPPENPVF